MEILFKNTTPSVSLPSGISCRITMIKAAEGVPLFTPMKMIEDLGMQYPTPNSKSKKHLAIYTCPLCREPFRTDVNIVNKRGVRYCRCIQKKLFLERNTKHGLWKHPLYGVYMSMKQRCTNPNDKQYPEWGGRGITVCEEWSADFLYFYNWAISNGYEKGLLIDRENNNKEYSPENCRWVVSNISNENTRLLRKSNTSGYRGLYFIKTGERLKRWVAEIHYNGEKYRLGYHLTPELAAQAYNDFVIAHGTAHPLNIIR